MKNWIQSAERSSSKRGQNSLRQTITSTLWLVSTSPEHTIVEQTGDGRHLILRVVAWQPSAVSSSQDTEETRFRGFWETFEVSSHVPLWPFTGRGGVKREASAGGCVAMEVA